MGKRRKNSTARHHNPNAARHKTVHKPEHWHVYLRKRIVFFTILALAGFIAEHFFRVWYLGKGGEVIIGVLVDRFGGAIIFGEEITTNV